MEPDQHFPARRRLLTGAAAFAAAAALTPLTQASAASPRHKPRHRRTTHDGDYPPVRWFPAHQHPVQIGYDTSPPSNSIHTAAPDSGRKKNPTSWPA